MSLVKMLEKLKEAGITTAPEISLEEIEKEFDDYERFHDNYEGLLCILGSGSEDDWEIPRSHNIWYFDTECIYNNGDYVAIAQRLKLLAGNALPIEEITDYVGDEEAWIAFILYKQRYKWNLTVRGDWADLTIFSHFANLLPLEQQGVQFIYQAQAQACLIGCATSEQRQFLNSLPGLDFEYLSYIAI